MVFESNYRFTEFNEAILISQSQNDDYPIYLYKLSLPCSFNPFLYIIFKNTEVHAIDVLGNIYSDTVVLIQRSKTINDVKFDVRKLLDENQLYDITYEISDQGEMKIQSYFESEYCLDKYIKWSQKQYCPFFYHDDSNAEHQIRLVYKSEQNALELIQLSSSTDVPKHTINDFMSDLVSHFIKLFIHEEMFSSIVEHVKLIYKVYFNEQKPMKVFSDIGSLLLKLQSKESIHDVLETHFITCIDKMSKELIILKEPPSTEIVYIVEFHHEFLNITTPSNENIEIKYKNPSFRYEFILPF